MHNIPGISTAKIVALAIQFTLLISIHGLIPVAPAKAQSCEYWVAPPAEGDDANAGTFANPWATIEHAAASVPDNNCIVWFKDGIYLTNAELDQRYSTVTTFKAVNPYRAAMEYNSTVLKLNGVKNMIFEGFEFRHVADPKSGKHVVLMDRSDDLWSENITFRNNIFHDSYNNDLLKIHNGVRFAIVENNVFYNQAGFEQHIDVNSVTDVVIQDNIFFNDFAGSERSDDGTSKHFIVIKDSNLNTDGLEGSERITVRRNIFMNREGGQETFVQVGNDGKPYHEAEDVWIENNLLIGNSDSLSTAAFGVSGGNNVTFANNTVVGDLPAKAYAFRVAIKGSNPKNKNILFYNNIWSDPTGTMGIDPSGNSFEFSNEFSDGNPDETSKLVLNNNLYWNGGEAIPPGDLVSPLSADENGTVADPLLNTDHESIILPRWNGKTFLSGNRTIRQEFQRLVEQYGKIPPNSPAIGKADPDFAPAEDILGRLRTPAPDLGAYEYQIRLMGASELTTIWLNWSPVQEPDASTLVINYSTGAISQSVTGLPPDTRDYTLANLAPNSRYLVTLAVYDGDNKILTQSNPIVLFTADDYQYLPSILRSICSEIGNLCDHRLIYRFLSSVFGVGCILNNACSLPVAAI